MHLGPWSQALAKKMGEVTRKHRLFVFAVLMLVFWGTVVYALAAVKYNGDWRGFFRLGSEFYHPPVMRDIPRDSPWGYDGQFYAALATDPLLRKLETRQAVDTPSYRAQRVFLPALAWLLGLGDAHAALWWYLALVWVLGLGSVLIVAWWLVRDGASVFWALPLAVTGGLVVSLTRATPDAAAVTLVLATLLALERRQWSWGTAFLAAAVLTRETSLLLVPVIVLWQWREKRWIRGLALVAPALGAFAGWRAYLYFRLDAALFTSGLGNLGLPLAWVPWKLRQVFSVPDVNGIEVLGVLALLATLCSPVVVAPRVGLVELSYLAFWALGVTLGPSVVTEAYAYARVLLALPFFAVLLAVKAKGRWQRLGLASVPVLFALLGLALIRGETVVHGGPWAVLKAVLARLGHF